MRRRRRRHGRSPTRRRTACRRRFPSARRSRTGRDERRLERGAIRREARLRRPLRSSPSPRTLTNRPTSTTTTQRRLRAPASRPRREPVSRRAPWAIAGTNRTRSGVTHHVTGRRHRHGWRPLRGPDVARTTRMRRHSSAAARPIPPRGSPGALPIGSPGDRRRRGGATRTMTGPVGRQVQRPQPGQRRRLATESREARARHRVAMSTTWRGAPGSRAVRPAVPGRTTSTSAARTGPTGSARVAPRSTRRCAPGSRFRRCRGSS
jgi:hypothetical protein